MPRTLQQQRAASAFNQITAAQNRENFKEYASLVRGLPAMVQNDGLAPTLAFLLAKAKNNNDSPYGIAYNQLDAWVTGQLGTQVNLIEWVINQDSAEYRRATAEAMAYLHWLKRFAEAKSVED